MPTAARAACVVLAALALSPCVAGFPARAGAEGPAAAAALCADKGIFAEYDARPELVALCPRAGERPAHDRDGDGIDDVLDVVRGARKTALNADAYKSSYVLIPYPGGDVPRSIGVCSDVIVRALRNAGLDLQKEVHEDIMHRPARYPWIERADTSIDHRRVRNLLAWFERATPERSARVDETASQAERWADWHAGDVVFLDTFPSRPGIEHVGIVSERRAADGRPLVVNNWTDGYRTSDMDLLSFVRPVRRFRPLAGSDR
jgi:uncharacterized protein YijF (DUF1287 family)